MRHHDIEGGSKLAAGLRWVAAGVIVLAVHAGAIAVLVREPEPAATALESQPALEVDLEPVEGEKTPDEMPPTETSGDPARAAAAATDAAAAMDAPAPAPTLVAPPEVEPAPPSQPPLPEPPKVELQPPPPEPEPPKVEAVPPAPTPLPSRASAASAATAASEETAPSIERLSKAREAAWRGKLAAHLNRFRRFPPGSGSGTTRVRFTIDVQGRVTEIGIVSGSGNAALDAAARRLIERASPFPPPPAGVPEQGLSFVVPVHFEDRQPR